MKPQRAYMNLSGSKREPKDKKAPKKTGGPLAHMFGKGK